jgi:chemotaxis signal transduction protein
VDVNSKIALFSLDAATFALPVAGIRYILSAPRLFALPLLRSEFCGVFLYQGELIPLLNLWKRFDMAVCPSANQFTVVMSTEAGLVGLPAGQVRRIVDQKQGTLEDASDEDLNPGSCRIFICAGTRYPLLDIEGLIAGVLPTKETTPVLSSQGTKEA